MEGIIPLMGAAALAGLAGSPHCVGMCGGFVAASGGGLRQAAWHMGRATTYAILGAAAGSLGWALPWPWMGHVLAAVMLFFFAGRLAGLVPELGPKLPFLAKWGGFWARQTGLGGRYAFGMVTGLLPCGLVYAALALAVGGGSPLAGALAMLAFAVGTTPLLAGAAGALRALTQRFPRARLAIAAGVLLLGLGALAMRPPAPAPGAVQSAPACH